MNKMAAGGTRRVDFVVSGEAPKYILVRAVGPTLSTLGINGGLADPQVDLYSGPNFVNRNDNWGGGADLMKVFNAVGATPLISVDSKDAALLMMVAPGAYSAIVSEVNGLGGVVLIEVYELP
jgi:hypothetical protein